jgi:hypothetical protein
MPISICLVYSYIILQFRKKLWNRHIHVVVWGFIYSTRSSYILFCMNVIKLEATRILIRVKITIKIMPIWRLLYFDIAIILGL